MTAAAITRRMVSGSVVTRIIDAQRQGRHRSGDQRPDQPPVALRQRARQQLRRGEQIQQQRHRHRVDRAEHDAVDRDCDQAGAEAGIALHDAGGETDAGGDGERGGEQVGRWHGATLTAGRGPRKRPWAVASAAPAHATAATAPTASTESNATRRNRAFAGAAEQARPRPGAQYHDWRQHAGAPQRGAVDRVVEDEQEQQIADDASRECEHARPGCAPRSPGSTEHRGRRWARPCRCRRPSDRSVRRPPRRSPGAGRRGSASPTA